MRGVRIRNHRQTGSSLLEGLLAIVLFSMGLLAMLRLLTTTIVESGNAQYRSEASLLASDLIGQMWTGDHTYKGLSERFGQSSADDYQRWLSRVESRLPGVSATANAPSVAIDTDRKVTVVLKWQVASDKEAHQLTLCARIVD